MGLDFYLTINMSAGKCLTINRKVHSVITVSFEYLRIYLRYNLGTGQGATTCKYLQLYMVLILHNSRR